MGKAAYHIQSYVEEVTRLYITWNTEVSFTTTFPPFCSIVSWDIHYVPYNHALSENVLEDMFPVMNSPIRNTECRKGGHITQRE